MIAQHHPKRRSVGMTFSTIKYHRRKRFGQHFLASGSIADRIVESAGIGDDDTVLEIGPGKGVLTERLIERARSVIAVEIDSSLSALLRARFEKTQGFTLVEGDILKTDIAKLLKDAISRVLVVSNLPYNISTPVIELFIRNRTLISRAVVMIQKEVAARLLAAPGSREYGLTTLNLALCAKGKKLMDVKPGAFDPPPEVMSRVVQLDFDREYFYPLEDEQMFRAVTGVAFRQRRKMVRNTLLPFLRAKGISAGDSEKLLAIAGIDPRVRPEDLDVEKYVMLSNACTRHMLSGQLREIEP